MKKLVIAGLLILLAGGCVNAPEPWKPDASTDTNADSRSRNADGTGEIAAGEVKAPDTTPDVKVIDVVDIVALPEVVDTVVPEDTKDISPDVGEVTPDVPGDIDAGDVCEPQCMDEQCGDDGCGGDCGGCEDGIETCILGGCHPDYCAAGLGDFGCCSGQVLFHCEDGELIPSNCGNNDSPYDICGWKIAIYQCGGDGEDPTGELPIECCMGDCTDKECGKDGCWGDCGQCGGNEECTDGECTCLADSLLCDGVCCVAGEVCAEDVCCAPDCKGKACGEDGCGGICGQCNNNEECTDGVCGCIQDSVLCNDICCQMDQVCFDESCCAIDCDGKNCGIDGCGGACGECGDNEECLEGTCGCVQDSDQCEDTCCPVGQVCFDEACCTLDCDAKECGGDGCGGSCGECLPGQACINSGCPMNGKQCDDGNDVDWDGCTSAGEIAEFQVNEYANAGQSQPDVASLSSGGYVTVWTTHHAQVPGDTEEIFGRIFTKSGAAAGEEFMANTFVAGSQYRPRVAGLHDGGFVVVWQSQNQDNDGVGVFGQRYSAAYTPVGEEFQANTVFAGGQGGPDVCALESGGFIVTWYSSDEEADGIDIKAQAFGSEGTKEGEELQVNAFEFGHQNRPSIASSPSGNALVVWESEPAQDGDGYGVFGRIINGDGALVGNEFPVNTYSSGGQLYPVAVSTASGYAAFWQSENQFGQQTWIVGQAYNSNGGKTTGEFQVSGTGSPEEYWARPDACSLADGRMVVVWQRLSGYWEIAARLFSSNAVPEKDEFRVNQFAGGSAMHPVTASTGDGGFVVVWTCDEQDGSSNGIFAQRFDKDGNKLYH